MNILAFDVSGNFKEGKGTSGICYMKNGQPKELSELKASDYKTAEAYWTAHIQLIRNTELDVVVIEGYRLYNNKKTKANMQSNSELETPQLIGVLRVTCASMGIPLIIQSAAQAKPRWKEDVLVATGHLEERNSRYYFQGKQTSPHKRDALKHALHFWNYGKEAIS